MGFKTMFLLREPSFWIVLTSSFALEIHQVAQESVFLIRASRSF